MKNHLLNTRLKAGYCLPILLLTLLFLGGCRSIGPKSIHANRGSYIEALSRTDKEEMLANIVRAKYNDPPVFLKIKTISASPRLETGAEAEAKLSATEHYGVIKPRLVYSDSPSILYTPLMGSEYSTQLLMPMGLMNLFLMLNNGFDLEIVADLMIITLNGKSNSRNATEAERNEFRSVMQAMNRLYKKRLINFATNGKGGDPAELSIAIDVRADALENEDYRYLIRELGLEKYPGTIEMKMGFSKKEHVFAVNTRSFLALMNYLSNFVDIPEVHRQWVWKSEISPDSGNLHIRCSKTLPRDANTAVYLYNHWFYIGAEDIGSQNILYLMQILFDIQAHIASSNGEIQLTMPIR
ncbi:MAG: hypothetical protein LWW85_05690 [Marinilabiliales bacterium]|nr:hypothetical protein [Marinilabiliales bacterium]